MAPDRFVLKHHILQFSLYFIRGLVYVWPSGLARLPHPGPARADPTHAAAVAEDDFVVVSVIIHFEMPTPHTPLLTTFLSSVCFFLPSVIQRCENGTESSDPLRSFRAADI